MTAVDRVADNNALEDDLEGVDIHDRGGGRGYILVSNRGDPCAHRGLRSAGFGWA